jgi:hypothetical protein
MKRRELAYGTKGYIRKESICHREKYAVSDYRI